MKATAACFPFTSNWLFRRYLRSLIHKLWIWKHVLNKTKKGTNYLCNRITPYPSSVLLSNIMYFTSMPLPGLELGHARSKIMRIFNCTVHSCQQKSIGLKFSRSQTGSDVRYSCHHNSSRFTFLIFAHSCRFSVLHSLQSITPRIY